MKTTALLIVGLLLAASVHAQQKQPYVALTAYNHSFSPKLFPGSWNPALTVEYGFALQEKGRSRWHLPVRLLYLHHRHLYRAVGFAAGPRYQHVGRLGLIKGADFTLGYLHSFDLYRRYGQTSSGTYEPARDPGRGSLLPALRLSLGYDFSAKMNLPVEVLLSYQMALQSPFSGVLPFIPHAGFQAGASFYLASK